MRRDVSFIFLYALSDSCDPPRTLAATLYDRRFMNLNRSNSLARPLKQAVLRCNPLSWKVKTGHATQCPISSLEFPRTTTTAPPA